MWFDGELKLRQEARVPLDDHGLLLGDGAFETVRIHRSAPFPFARHLARLEQGLQTIGLAGPLPWNAVLEGARAVVRANRLEEGLLRITVVGSAGDPAGEGHVLLSVRSLPRIDGPASLILFTSQPRLPGPLSRSKTLSRTLESWALREARKRGAFNALLLNPSGRLVETTSRNVFLVLDGTAWTPPVEEGALPGVTRDAVLHLAADAGLKASERPLEPHDLAEASEVFLTGSGVGVLGISSVEDHRYDPIPGPVTRRFAACYEDLLERESRW